MAPRSLKRGSSRRHRAEPWLVVLLLPGCANPSVPQSGSPTATAWDPAETPYSLLESVKQFPAVGVRPGANGGGAGAREPFPLPNVTRAVTPTPPATPEPADGAAVEYADLGTTLTLHATAEGSPPFTFQWMKDSRPVAGAVQAKFTLDKVSGADEGIYVCVVSNAAGSQVSPPIKVVVRTP